MSRALGAAFLSHQVEQLEKSVSAAPPRPSPSRNHNSNNNNNWRDRQRPQSQPSADSKRGQLPIGGIRITTTHAHQQHQQQKERPVAAKNRGAEDSKKTSAKEADIIVVDASVLVNALGQVKKWCRDGQDEIMIVPLEGTVLFFFSLSHISPSRLHAVMLARMLYRGPHLAPALRRQRYVTPPDSPGKARHSHLPSGGSSFALSACQPRGVRSIQSPDPLPPALNTLDLLKKGSTPLAQRARTASRVLESQVGTNPRVRVQQDSAFVLWDKIAFDEDPTTTTASTPNSSAIPPSTSPSPEWVRRTICCAQWETEHADAAHPRVVLAALAQQLPQQPQQLQRQQSSVAADEPAPAQTASPVPLPAPHHAQQHKHEPRVTGSLVTHWARRAHLAVLEVPAGSDGRVSPEDRRPAHNHHNHHNPHHHRGRGGGGGGGMVERPPAVKAMMDVIAQPSRVVRVLARGEKLDP
jgi:hypothetical protein